MRARDLNAGRDDAAMITKDFSGNAEIIINVGTPETTDAAGQLLRKGPPPPPKIPIRFLPRRVHKTEPPPHIDPTPGAGSMPTPAVFNFPSQHGLVPSPGSGVETIIFRRAELHITAGTPSGGWLLGPLRQIQWARNGSTPFDAARDFSFSGWGSGSASNLFTWTANRIFLPGHDFGSDQFRAYFKGGTQSFRVRDQYHNGGVVAWSPWGECVITWPPDQPAHPGDPAEVAYLELARIDDAG